MKNFKKFLFVFILLFVLIGITHAEEETATEPILGCTDGTATNYNLEATEDDSSCIYLETPSVPDPVSIHLTITTNDGNLYDQDMNVTACDSDNPNTGNLTVTAYCAVLQSGLESDWNFDWAPGIFLNSINNITGFTSQNSNGDPVYHYWSWSLNGNYAEVGLNEYELETNDLILLDFIDPVDLTPVEANLEPENPAPQSHSSSGGHSSSRVEKKKFDYDKALEFVASQQNENGTFGAEMYTDWTALALASSEDYQEQKEKLINYFSENEFTGELLTDFERHAMALMALNLNPYKINDLNYIEKITDSFDGKQFGEIEQVNDDIFALIVLQNAGFDQDKIMIKNTIDFIFSQQKENGSWDGNVDLTGAGIEALIKFRENEIKENALTTTPTDGKINSALEKARKYLKENQNNDGSWENVSSTAWALQGILALGEKIEDSTLEYLGNTQEEDGSVETFEEENLETKIWKTAYATTSVSGKTWNQIMKSFEQPKLEIAPTLTETHQTKFTKKIEKFQKPIDIQIEIPEETNSKQVEKESWLVHIWKWIFGSKK